VQANLAASRQFRGLVVNAPFEIEVNGLGEFEFCIAQWLVGLQFEILNFGLRLFDVVAAFAIEKVTHRVFESIA